MELNRQGIQLVQQDRLEQALDPLREAVGIAPEYYPAANTLAQVLFHLGKLDEAIAIQRQGTDSAALPNAFGMANLAALLYAAGEEQEAERCLEQALGMEMLTDDICTKVCETLARFKRHQGILDLAARADFTRNAATCYFTGVAAANTGDRERAAQDLRQTVLSQQYGARARRYLEWLRDNSEPYTILGDWPYLAPADVLPLAIIPRSHSDEQRLKDFLTRRVLVDFCEASINETPGDAVDILNFLGLSTHPESGRLLKAILFGTFGPDELRQSALQALSGRRELEHGQTLEIFLDGKRRTLQLMNTKINPNLRFGVRLQGRLHDEYCAALEAMVGDDPDWEKLGETFSDLYKQVPEHFPALFNYAVSLLNRNRMDEAEPLLRELVRDHPAYLYAHATLLKLYRLQDRIAEARELVKVTDMPNETQPDAMAAWHIELSNMYKQTGDDEKARRHIKFARDICPEMLD